MSNNTYPQDSNQPDPTLPALEEDKANTPSSQSPLPPLPSPSTMSNSNAGTPSTMVALPSDAQDSDLIEKEWVEKAKDIVERTNDDPYTQQEELAKMKADYMKKRFNKDIKLNDQQG